VALKVIEKIDLEQEYEAWAELSILITKFMLKKRLTRQEVIPVRRKKLPRLKLLGNFVPGK
jgi:hypothetical protein